MGDRITQVRRRPRARFPRSRLSWLGDTPATAVEGVLELCRSRAGRSPTGAATSACLPDYPGHCGAPGWSIAEISWCRARGELLRRSRTRRLRLQPGAMRKMESESAPPRSIAPLDHSDWYRALARPVRTLLISSCCQRIPFVLKQPAYRRIAERPVDTYRRWMEVGDRPDLAGLPGDQRISAGAAGLPMGLPDNRPAPSHYGGAQLALTR